MYMNLLLVNPAPEDALAERITIAMDFRSDHSGYLEARKVEALRTHDNLNKTLREYAKRYKEDKVVFFQ